jgi:hypothetical protein
LPLPLVHAEVDHYVGSVVGGSVPGVAFDFASAAPARFATVSVFALERMPLEALEPAPLRLSMGLGAGATLFVRKLLTPLRATTDLAAAAAWTGSRNQPQGDRVRHVADLFAALPGGVAATFLLSRPAPSDVDGAQLALLIGRGSPMQLEIGLAALRSDEPTGLTGELCALPLLPDGTIRGVLVVPSPFRGEAAKAFAIRYTVEPIPKETDPRYLVFRSAWDQARRQIADRARVRPERFPRELQPELTRVDARGLAALLAQPEAQRRTLVTVCERTGATIARDLLLAASDEGVASVADTLRPALLETEVAGGAELGWLVERTALLTLIARMIHGAASPGVATVLLEHAGPLGDQAEALLFMVQETGDLASFRARILEENVLLLRDGVPEVRARATNWLAHRDLAPEGFDPFAPRAERSAALKRAEDAARAKAEAEASKKEATAAEEPSMDASAPADAVPSSGGAP